MKKFQVMCVLTAVLLAFCGCSVMDQVVDEYQNQVGSALQDGLGQLEDDFNNIDWDSVSENVNEIGENVGEFIEENVDTSFVEETKVYLRINELKITNGTRYEGSGQCKGFAVKVFKQLFGADSVVPSTKSNNYELDESGADSVTLVGTMTDMAQKSDDEIKALFSNARPGDIVQMKRSHGGPHTAIVVSVSDTGVVWYEANLDGNNGIVENTYTWAQLRDGINGYRINVAMSVYTATNYSLSE